MRFTVIVKATRIPKNPVESWRRCLNMDKIDMDGLKQAYEAA